jgi:hypothetical protein
MRAMDTGDTPERAPPQGTILQSEAGSVVVALLIEELARRLSRDHSVQLRYFHGDDTVEGEAIEAACVRAAVTLEDYLTTLEADDLLRQLHHAALTEAMVGTADPGPNDQISRESPCGDESNRHFNDWMLRKNSP